MISIRTGRLCLGFLCYLCISSSVAADCPAKPGVSSAEGEASLSAVPTRGRIGFRFDYEEYKNQGAFRVASIGPGEVAVVAGLQVGDLITRVNGEGFRFETRSERMLAFTWVCPGDELQLQVVRNGAEKTIRLIADMMPQAKVLEWLRFEEKLHLDVQASLLRTLSRGSGVKISVAREGESGQLLFELPQPMATDPAETEKILRQMAPMIGPVFDRLKKGDGFEVLLRSRGRSLDWLFGDEVPAYLVEALDETVESYGAQQRSLPPGRD